MIKCIENMLMTRKNLKKYFPWKSFIDTFYTNAYRNMIKWNFFIVKTLNK